MSDLTPEQMEARIKQLSGYLVKADERVIELQAQVKELEDPGWEQFINLATQWLEKYPPDIFTGESGDPGPLFVVALRNAIAALAERNK